MKIPTEGDWLTMMAPCFRTMIRGWSTDVFHTAFLVAAAVNHRHTHPNRGVLL